MSIHCKGETSQNDVTVVKRRHHLKIRSHAKASDEELFVLLAMSTRKYAHKKLEKSAHLLIRIEEVRIIGLGLEVEIGRASCRERVS